MMKVEAIFWFSPPCFLLFYLLKKGGAVAVISELLFAAFCVYIATTQAGKEKDVLDVDGINDCDNEDDDGDDCGDDDEGDDAYTDMTAC